MVARGFKPVGWVAAVAGAALGCYMLSLNVASERAELAGLERRIVAARQDIRALQTELGTRGRMAQLDHWNAEVLALSAPTSAQFLDDEFTLARFDRTEPTIEDKAKVRMAAAPAAPRRPAVEAPVQLASADDLRGEAKPVVQRAALVIDDKPAAPVRKASLIDDGLAAVIGRAAKAERGGGAGGQ